METLIGRSMYFHHGWRFLRADAFPMREAFEKHRDKDGKYFYMPGYDDTKWEKVTVPHTFNDADLFRDRIKDAGSGQTRTAAFYRNILHVPREREGQRVLIEFEGMRQTCYLYVNGELAGYYEAGAAPFGFDITGFIKYGEDNLIAIATDNTATRDTGFCIAETPNKPDAEPGSYLLAQDDEVDETRRGVGFFWNCNDFNPSVGGITKPVKVHFKPEVHLTLPLYSNLQTTGTYIYGTDLDPEAKKARIAVEAEFKNESGKCAEVMADVIVRDHRGRIMAHFSSETVTAEPAALSGSPVSIVPEDAYVEKILLDGRKTYVPVDDEDSVKETMSDPIGTGTLKAVSEPLELRFWSIDDPYLYRIEVRLFCNGDLCDGTEIETGFRHTGYSRKEGLEINGVPVWLRGYAQRASNEWAAIGAAPEWLKDLDMMLVKESNANHIRWMHVAASPADIRAADRHGVVCTQPAGDKEQENFGRQWDQRVELMRDIIIAFRNHPSIIFWEAGNNSINKKHMREMRLLKEKLDPHGGRFMGCRTLNTEDVINESEYVGTMLNRHAAGFTAEHGPVTETEYMREEAPRRVWDDFSPPDFDYRTKWLGKGGLKQPGFDYYDLTSEDLALAAARGYSEFFNDRIGGASGKDLYTACAALCWTDSAQHGRQAYSENARMSGRVDPVRVKKQSFDVFRVMQSPKPAVKIFGHWNYPPDTAENYNYHEKRFNGSYWEDTGKILRRDPKNKTVYVFGSYGIKSVELFINGRSIGVCDRPADTFVFAFNGIDITENGVIEAVGTAYDGSEARDTVRTAGAPARLELVPHTAPGGAAADGGDVIAVDIAVTDDNGQICPLCYDRIDLSVSGCGVLLGGYNSGRFDGHGRNDSVIHKDHVYAECGTNRVFIRTTETAGEVTLNAAMGDIKASISVTTRPVPLSVLTETEQPAVYEEYPDVPPDAEREFVPIPEADAVKYVPETRPYCKILVNGQEPDTRGVRSENKNGSVWGAVLCILGRLDQSCGDRFEYSFDGKNLVLRSGGREVTAEVGRTHLLVDGKENLMDGAPYTTPEGILVMEVNAIVPYIAGVTARFDDKIGVLRVETDAV